MLRSSSIKLYMVITLFTLLFSISSIPALGQTSNEEIISGIFGFISDGTVSTGLMKEGTEKTIELISNAHQCDNAVNSYNDAYEYYNKESYDLALMCINKSIEAWEKTGYLQGLPSVMGDVGPSDSWNLKGIILNRLGRYEEAINCFDVALNINPENYYAWANKGDVLYEQGNYEEAIKFYNSAIAINPTYTYAYLQKNNALSAFLILQSNETPQENAYDVKDGITTTYKTLESTSIVEVGAGYGGSAIAISGYRSGYIDGSGNISYVNRDVDTFDSIELEVPGNLYITQGEHQPLRIEGDDNVLQVLHTDVIDKMLIIDSDERILPTSPINIYASAEEIRKLSSGLGNIISQSQINSDTLEVDVTGSGSSNLSLNVVELDTAISGSGDVCLNGVAKVHNSVISGSGNVRAFDLSTEMTDIIVSGSGNAQVTVLNNLDVNILGSGVVYHKGNATVTSNISGSGRLIKS